jgi:hypothetical protein
MRNDSADDLERLDAANLHCLLRGDQEELFKLVILNFIFKWYNWSNFRLLMASH